MQSERGKLPQTEEFKVRRTLVILGLRKRTATKLSVWVFNTLNRWIATNGKVWAASRMKTIFKVVAGESPPPSNYIRGLDNNTFTCLSSLCRHLIRAGKRREVLTALSIFRRLKVEPVLTDKLISSVITPFTGKRRNSIFVCSEL